MQRCHLNLAMKNNKVTVNSSPYRSMMSVGKGETSNTELTSLTTISKTLSVSGDESATSMAHAKTSSTRFTAIIATTSHPASTNNSLSMMQPGTTNTPYLTIATPMTVSPIITNSTRCVVQQEEINTTIATTPITISPIINNHTTCVVQQEEINTTIAGTPTTISPIVNNNTTCVVQQEEINTTIATTPTTISPIVNNNTTCVVQQEEINTTIATTSMTIYPIINNSTTFVAQHEEIRSTMIDTATTPPATRSITTIPSQIPCEDNSEVNSDDEVEITSVVKGESKIKLSIKVESSDDDEIRTINPKSVTTFSSKDIESLKEDKKEGSDITCSICLSEFDNKSFLDQCFHPFCFYCILQWSEVVRTCPLCKAEFTQIIHSVKSMTEYQQHKLSAKANPTKSTSNRDRRFRYRTTLVDGRQNAGHSVRPPNAWEQRAERRERMIALKRKRSIRAKEKRHLIYSRNLWVQTVAQSGRAKYRDTSPQFLKSNPACTHRLVPWLTRELQCLLNDDNDHVDFILQLILSVITKISIDSQEFYAQLAPFLADKTEHFQHEFLSFARSPFEMKTYDDRAEYNWSAYRDEPANQTPVVIDLSASGWDSSPDDSQTSLLPFSDEPGPSGLSRNEVNQWSPPITEPLQIQHHEILSDVAEQSTNDILPEIIDVQSPTQKSKHRKRHHKHKHTRRSRVRHNDDKSPQLSTESNSKLVNLSYGIDSSPDANSDLQNTENNRQYSNHNNSRGPSSDRSNHENRQYSNHNNSRGPSSDRSNHENRQYSNHNNSRGPSSDRPNHENRQCSNHNNSRGPSSDRSNHENRQYSNHNNSRGPSSDRPNHENLHKGKRTKSRDRPEHKHNRKVRREDERYSRLSHPNTSHDRQNSRETNVKSTENCNSLEDRKESSLCRPFSPTEDEMKREIEHLEIRIAEDSKRLDELMTKQQNRKELSSSTSSLATEDIETDEQSR